MSVKHVLTGKSAFPVAQPAPPRVQVEPGKEDDGGEAVLLTPAGIKGWAISAAIHAVLLLVLALWVFTPSKPAPKTFDTRLLGSEFGVPEGLNTLGGIDMPVNIPEPPSPTSSSETKFTTLKSDDMHISTPTSGPANQEARNPGAGLGDGFGLARFGNGGEKIGGVDVKVGDPQFTLLWDTKVDLDLHVIEPGGKEIYWLDTKGVHNGELDVDNREGFGPENIYWLKENADGSKDKGLGPAGEYRWFVHYYRGFDNQGNIPTNWKVRVKHDGKVDIVTGKLLVKDSRSRDYVLKVGPAPGRETIRGR